MKFRTLPRTDLTLSEVGFGVWTVATDWWGKISEEGRASLLENALEKGVNFFDTADTYGEGFGEEILAKVLGHRRQEFIIGESFCGPDSPTRERFIQGLADWLAHYTSDNRGDSRGN